MYIDTDTDYQKKNITQEENFVGVRVFDPRRYGMLFQKYRKSGAWTIPLGKQIEPEMSMFELMKNVCRSIPLAGSKKITVARTLTEFTIDQAMQGAGEDEFVRWNVVIYHVEFKGAVVARCPSPSERYSERAFVAYADTITKLPIKNQITDRFIKALEKQTCLR